MAKPDFDIDIDKPNYLDNYTDMTEVGEVDESITMEELLEEYREVRNPKRTSTVRLSPERQVEEDARVAEFTARAESIFSRMIDLATDQIISTPSDQRLEYLTNLRQSFKSPVQTQNFSLSEENNFLDRLTVSAINRLTPPKQ